MSVSSSPMTRLRHIAVWVLLVAFAAGGAIGPVVHQVQHAAATSATTVEVVHSEAIHASSVPLWAQDCSPPDVLECDLCTRRLLVVPPAPSPVAGPSLTGTTQVATLSDVAPVQTVTDRFIRGPPSRLGDRLA